MKKTFLILLLIIPNLFGLSQKLYIIPSIKGEFSGLSYSKNYNSNEFQPALLNLYPQIKLDLLVKQKKLYHKVGLEISGITKNFRIENKFMKPPYNEPLLGYMRLSHSHGPFGYFLFSYGLQKDGKSTKGFLFHSKIRFNYYGGLGIGYLPKNTFTGFDSVTSRYAGSSLNSYMGYYSKGRRDGLGYFLKVSGGFDFINKKNKRSINLGAYLNLGLKRMAHFITDYEYGWTNLPDKQVKVNDLVMNSRGSTFGFTFGVPVYIKKLEKEIPLNNIKQSSKTSRYVGKHNLFVSAGPSYSFVINNDFFSYYFKNGFGYNISLGFQPSKLGLITTTYRYIQNKLRKEDQYLKFNYLRAGYRTYFLNSGCFLGGEAGIRFYKLNSTHLNVCGVLGYSFRLNNISHLELSSEVNFVGSASDLSSFGVINLLYSIAIHKKTARVGGYPPQVASLRFLL